MMRSMDALGIITSVLVGVDFDIANVLGIPILIIQRQITGFERYVFPPVFPQFFISVDTRKGRADPQIGIVEGFNEPIFLLSVFWEGLYRPVNNVSVSGPEFLRNVNVEFGHGRFAKGKEYHKRTCENCR